MDISGELFEKEPSTVGLIPRGVEDILSDISDDLRKTLFASLDSIIPLSPRPAPREPANNDGPSCSSDELDGTPTFTNASTARNDDRLEDLVGSHELGLGLSIQQETPQLLMEGDTLDDQDTNCGQEEAVAVSPYEQKTAKVFITDTALKRIDDIDTKVISKSIRFPLPVSSQSTDSINTPLDPVILSTSDDVDVSLPAVVTSSPDLNSLLAHVSNPVTSLHMSPSINSLSAHVSSPMNLSTPNASDSLLSANTISYALTLLAANPEITSSPFSFNGFGTNDISLPQSLSSKSSSSSKHHHSGSLVAHNPAADNNKCCDDIIGQSLLLAHDAIHSSPDQLPESHDPPRQVPQPKDDKRPPMRQPTNNHCTRSRDQQESHDQDRLHDLHKSHDQQMDYNTESNTMPKVNLPSKITFIDWTQRKRKNVTPLHYPNSPIPVDVKLSQDETISAPSSKKKKNNTNQTGKKRGWVKGRPRKKLAINSIIKQMPKPPRTGYVYYLSDSRGEVMKNNPHLSMGEISSHLAKEWNKLSSEQRQSYMDKGYADRQRYLQELVTYYHQKSKDFQQQDPTFDPQWASNYLSQYLSDSSDDLYCPVCNVQFSSLHNKQQHCLSHKHNKQVITFVQESIRNHQKQNGSISNNNENCSPNYMISSRNHSSSDTNMVTPAINHIAGTKDSIGDHVNRNVDHMNNTEDHVSIAKDSVNNTEDHMSCHVNNTEDQTSVTENSNTCQTSDPKDSLVLSNVEKSPSSELDHTDVINNANEDVVMLTDSRACCSVDHANNDETSMTEGSAPKVSCDQPTVCFPPYYSLNHVMHDFKLHQQGMLNKLNESKLLLLSRYAQLQGDCNELEAKVEDLEKQLQYRKQENKDLLIQMETLSGMIRSTGQTDNA